MSECRRWSRYLVSTDPGGGSPPSGWGRDDADQAVHRPQVQDRVISKASYFRAGQLLEDSDGQKGFRREVQTPWKSEARGPGTDTGRSVPCRAACAGRPTEGSRDPAEPGGLGVSMPPNLLQPRNPQAEPPRPEYPPFSPGPADHYLKLEGPNNAPKETPVLVVCFLFNFPTNTLFYHPKP